MIPSSADRNYFQKFPIASVIWVIIGIALFSISFDFLSILKFFRENPEFIHWINYIKTTIGTIIIGYSSIYLLNYFIKFSSKKEYTSHLADIHGIFLEELRKNGDLLADFFSFRPWMSDEYYVKIDKNYFAYTPLYLIGLYTKNDFLYISEAKAKVKSKSYEMTGYHVIPIKSIDSISLTQDRILFSTVQGDDSATVYFFEIRTHSGTVRIPIFEVEILSRHANESQIESMKKEFLSKIIMLTKLLTNSSKKISELGSIEKFEKGL
ncbi:MAG: hypothetical protein ACK4R7_03740 [Fervidobacterium sp.]